MSDPYFERPGLAPLRAAAAQAEFAEASRGLLSADGYPLAGGEPPEAGVSYGTFYTYFTGKDVVFRELAYAVVDELYEATTSSHRGAEAVARVESANRRFVKIFRKNAEFIRVIEQVATINLEFEQLRRSLRTRAGERVEVTIRRYIADGVADSSIDPHIASHALIGMVYYFCYAWLSLGEPFDDEAAVETLTTLWVRGLGLSPAKTRNEPS